SFGPISWFAFLVWISLSWKRFFPVEFTGRTLRGATRAFQDRVIGVRLVIRSGDGFGLSLLILRRHLVRLELNSQLVELSGEAERRLVVLVIHPRAGINPDIEGLIDRKERWDGMRDRLASDFLAVHR